MKKTLFFILFIPLVIFSQNLKVTSIDPITDSSQGAFFYPSFSNDGTKIIFTSESYKGLWLHDLKTQNTTQINDLTGSGYKPVFIGNDESIIFRTDNFSNDGRTSSLRKVELNSKNETILIDFTRELSAPLYAKSNGVVYLSKSTPAFYSYEQNQPALNVESTDRVVFIDNSDLVLFTNGTRTVLNPLGEGNYIWASVSPDNSKILFRLAGKGSYITDLNGNIISELGDANAPQWSYDGKWIAYMVDKDDGERVLSSDIFAVSVDGTVKTNLTNSPGMKAMYPSWSPNNDKIVFNTDDGRIHIINLTIE